MFTLLVVNFTFVSNWECIIFIYTLNLDTLSNSMHISANTDLIWHLARGTLFLNVMYIGTHFKFFIFWNICWFGIIQYNNAWVQSLNYFKCTCIHTCSCLFILFFFINLYCLSKYTGYIYTGFVYRDRDTNVSFTPFFWTP